MYLALNVIVASFFSFQAKKNCSCLNCLHTVKIVLVISCFNRNSDVCQV